MEISLTMNSLLVSFVLLTITNVQEARQTSKNLLPSHHKQNERSKRKLNNKSHLLLPSDNLHKSIKRWMDESYAQADDQSIYSQAALDGFISAETDNTKADQSGRASVFFGLGDGQISDMEIKNDLNNNEAAAKQTEGQTIPEEMYSQDMTSFLKPGIGDYPSDMPAPQNDPYYKQSSQKNSHKQQLFSDEKVDTSSFLLDDGALNTDSKQKQQEQEKEKSKENGNGKQSGNSSDGVMNVANDVLSQNEVTPAKVIDSALAKITSEASKLILENGEEQSGNGSGVKETSHEGGATVDDKELSDEAFVMKLAGSNDGSDEDKGRNEKIKVKDEEEKTNKTNTGESISVQKEKTSEKEKSEQEDEEKKGSRRESYTLYDNGIPMESVELPTGKKMSNYDSSEKFDSTNNYGNDAKEKLPSDLLVSTLKQALLSNVKELLKSESGDIPDDKNKDFSTNDLDTKESGKNEKVNNDVKKHPNISKVSNPHNEYKEKNNAPISSKDEENAKGNVDSDITEEKVKEHDDKNVKGEPHHDEHSYVSDRNSEKEDLMSVKNSDTYVMSNKNTGKNVALGKNPDKEDTMSNKNSEKGLSSSEYFNKDSTLNKNSDEDLTSNKTPNKEDMDTESNKNDKKENKNSDEEKFAPNKTFGNQDLSPHGNSDMTQENESKERENVNLLEENLMKIDKKKLVKMLVKLIRGKKSDEDDSDSKKHHHDKSKKNVGMSTATEKQSTYDKSPYIDHPIKFSSSSQTSLPKMLYFHKQYVGLTGDARGSMSSDPYANIGLTDPSDGAKPLNSKSKDTNQKYEQTRNEQSHKENSEKQNGEKVKSNEVHSESAEATTEEMEQQLQNEKAKLQKLKESKEIEEEEKQSQTKLENNKPLEETKAFGEIDGGKHAQGSSIQSDIVNVIADKIDKTIVDQIMEKEKSLENQSDLDPSYSSDVSSEYQASNQGTPHRPKVNKISISGTESSSTDSTDEKSIQKLIHQIKEKLLREKKLKQLSLKKKLKPSTDDVYAQIGSSDTNPTLRKRIGRVKKQHIHHTSVHKKRHRRVG